MAEPSPTDRELDEKEPAPDEKERPADTGGPGDWGNPGRWGTFGNRPDVHREQTWRENRD